MFLVSAIENVVSNRHVTYLNDEIRIAKMLFSDFVSAVKLNAGLDRLLWMSDTPKGR